MNEQFQKQANQLFQQGRNFLQQAQLDLERKNFNSAEENLNRARENLNRALDIIRDINTEEVKRLQVDILNTLGQSHNYPYAWNLAQSIEICEESLHIARSTNYRHGEAIALTLIGKAYYWYDKDKRDFRKAIECYEAAKAIFQETKDLGRLLDTLYHLQDAYGYVSKYAQAIDSNSARLKIAKQLILIGEEKNEKELILLGKETEANALFCLGSNYQSLGEYAEAEEHYNLCLTKAEEIDGWQAQWLKIYSLIGLGNISRIKGNLEEAEGNYQKSLEVAENSDEQGQANALQALAEIYYYQGKLDEASKCNEQSLEIKQRLQDQIGTGNSIGFQGSISLARGNYNEALDQFEQSLQIMEKVNNASGSASTLTDMGFTYYYLGKIAEAEQCLNEAIETWEAIRKSLGSRDEFKVSIFEQQARTYQLQQAILIVQQKITEALEIAERGRARAFVELLASRLSRRRTDELTISPPSFEEIKQVAQEQDSTLVEYSIIGSERLFIWVIQPTGKVFFRNVGLKPLLHNKTLEDFVLLTHEAIGVRGQNRNAGPAGRSSRNNLSSRLNNLYQLLIEPIADLLPAEDKAKVIFMPQGPLFQIPFSALKDNFGKFLIEKHTILTSPSIQVLQLTRKQQAKVQQAALREVLVLGNPTMPSYVPPLISLPGAEEEAREIALCLQTEAITGINGTKKVIVEKMFKARIIHLATHGLADNNRGLGSAIALAPSGDDNGWLTAQEILDLNLNAELVVLSACDTGRGRLTGDGVIGLSRSFISAGVPSIVVSLWAVPDSPTAKLMTTFYQHLQQKENYDKAQSLRQAMLKTMQRDPDPKNWAAFTLIGEAT